MAGTAELEKARGTQARRAGGRPEPRRAASRARPSRLRSRFLPGPDPSRRPRETRGRRDSSPGRGPAGCVSSRPGPYPTPSRIRLAAPPAPPVPPARSPGVASRTSAAARGPRRGSGGGRRSPIQRHRQTRLRTLKWRPARTPAAMASPPASARDGGEPRAPRRPPRPRPRPCCAQPPWLLPLPRRARPVRPGRAAQARPGAPVRSAELPPRRWLASFKGLSLLLPHAQLCSLAPGA